MAILDRSLTIVVAIAVCIADASASRAQTGSALAPWIGVSAGFGGLAAVCHCPYDLKGLTLQGTIGAGLDLTRTVSIGAEESGASMIITDGPNSGHFRMGVVRVSPLRFLSLVVGVGDGSYHQGTEPLVDHRLTGAFGVEYGFRRGPVQAAQFVEYFRSGLGAPQAIGQGVVRYRMSATHFGTSLRVHFVGG